MESLLGGPKTRGLPRGACDGMFRDLDPSIVRPWFHTALGQLLTLCPVSPHPRHLIGSKVQGPTCGLPQFLQLGLLCHDMGCLPLFCGLPELNYFIYLRLDF